MEVVLMKKKEYKPIKKGFLNNIASKTGDLLEKGKKTYSKGKEAYKNYEKYNDEEKDKKLYKLKKENAYLMEKAKNKKLKDKISNKWDW